MNNRQSKETREYGEILTPEWMVKDMLDATEPSVSSPSTPILDMYSGTGNFIVEIVRRRCMGASNPIDVISHTYACEIQNNNVTAIRDRTTNVLITAFPNECEDDDTPRQMTDMLEKNVICADALEYMPPEQNISNRIQSAIPEEHSKCWYEKPLKVTADISAILGQGTITQPVNNDVHHTGKLVRTLADGTSMASER